MNAVMSPPATEVAATERLQPFQCSVCNSRFTRYENLKRHAAVHSRSRRETSLTCNLCHTTFSRHDLRSRHMKRKHADVLDNARHDASPLDNGLASQEATPAREESLHILSFNSIHRSSPSMPHGATDEWLAGMESSLRPINQNHDMYNMRLAPIADLSTCIPTQHEEAPHLLQSTPVHSLISTEQTYNDPFSQEILDVGENPLLHESGSSHNFEARTLPRPFSDGSSVLSDAGDTLSYVPDGLSPKDIAYQNDEWSPSPAQSSRGYNLYFNHVSHFVPFLHRPTFDATEVPRHLGLSMLCLAYQHGEDPDSNDESRSGVRLSRRCFHRARVIAAFEEERPCDLDQTIVLVQAYWLLQVYATLYDCGDSSTYGHKLHTRMISLTRSGGLTKPLSTKSTMTEDLESLWRDFIKTESYKRTVFAVHQIDTLWYQLFSMPRSLSHLEIKHDLPCREDCWTAVSSSLWAHRELAARQSNQSIPYSEALRIILSPDPELDSVPKFDLYGAINIVQFLLSSAREVSGWSTMTGRFSLERYEPLHSSLIALEKLIRPQGRAADSIHAASCEATWEMAMLELLLWSPTHTSGIVGGSVGTFLAQSTQLAHSSDLQHQAATKDACQPHINWFLQYLENTHVFDFEPPWLLLYAYKAFLIAWQFLREGFPGAMMVVNVSDGDTNGAVLWAKQVFQRDHRPELNKLIFESLDILLIEK